jgi:glutathione S-transferase
MLTLYTFGPYFGLPDASPFVMKVEVLLNIAGLPYTTDTGGFARAPKGKLPFIEDDGEIIADSTFIRLHLERKYRLDFDKGLTATERAVAWAFVKMCEEHLYWPGYHARWMVDENFDKGPRRFFDAAPAPLRPFVIAMARRRGRRNLWGHGMGRHSGAEMETLALRDIDALAAYLGDKPYMMGNDPGSADATVFPFVAHALCPLFTTAILAGTRRHANLVSYRDRLMQQYFPDFSAQTGTAT